MVQSRPSQARAPFGGIRCYQTQPGLILAVTCIVLVLIFLDFLRKLLIDVEIKICKWFVAADHYDVTTTCVQYINCFSALSLLPGAYPEISKGGGGNFKPRQLKLLVGQAFSLVSADAGLRLPTCAFCHISPFNTLIFFILVYLGLQ